MTTNTPSYWSIEPRTWQSWVDALGPTAAAKLAGAVMSYFFDGIGPDESGLKLTRTAVALFETMRPALDRRRASAVNGKVRRGCGDVENSADRGEASHKNPEKPADETETDSQSAEQNSGRKNKAPQHRLPAETPNLGTHLAHTASTAATKSRNKNTPLPPAPSSPRVGPVEGAGVVSATEYDAMVSAGLAATTLAGYQSAVAAKGGSWRAAS